MPNTNDSSETTAIHAAYQGQVQTLFKSLIINLYQAAEWVTL